MHWHALLGATIWGHPQCEDWPLLSFCNFSNSLMLTPFYLMVVLLTMPIVCCESNHTRVHCIALCSCFKLFTFLLLIKQTDKQADKRNIVANLPTNRKTNRKWRQTEKQTNKPPIIWIGKSSDLAPPPGLVGLSLNSHHLWYERRLWHLEEKKFRMTFFHHSLQLLYTCDSFFFFFSVGRTDFKRAFVYATWPISSHLDSLRLQIGNLGK